jgi:hypothetical protein
MDKNKKMNHSPECILQLSGEYKVKRNIHLKWDEETIAEHDKERGTRLVK